MDVIEVQQPISGDSRQCFTARLIGGAARRAMDDQGIGRVLAVFQRSFYLETATGRLACLGAEGLGAGPLNGLCDLPGDWDWQARGLGPGAPVRRQGDTLQVGQRFACALSQAKLWRPAAFPAGWQRADLGEGLRALADQVRAPEDGLGRLIPDLVNAPEAPATGPDDSPVLARARPAAHQLTTWLDAGDGRSGEPVATDFVGLLLGLGPGLTPSGDDFLGGAMIALAALGEAGRARGLAELALPAAARLTGKISVAHLACAAEGEGAAALHEALAVLARPEPGAIATALAAIGRIGHCSGWDGLAGAVAVLAWRAARP
jgi:hypothetical protein